MKHPGEKLEGIEGFSKVTPDELEAIVAMVPFATPFRMLEIGTYMGATASFIAQERPQCRITSLDIVMRPEVIANRRDNQVFILSTAQQFLASMPGAKFDLIFIDGDHSYNGVAHDYRTALQLIANGGRIIFHDYTERQPESKRAIDDIAAQQNKTVKIHANSVAELV